MSSYLGNEIGTNSTIKLFDNKLSKIKFIHSSDFVSLSIYIYIYILEDFVYILILDGCILSFYVSLLLI